MLLLAMLLAAILAPLPPHAGPLDSSAHGHQLQQILMLPNPVWTGTECMRAPTSTNSDAVTSYVDWNRVHEGTNFNKFSVVTSSVQWN